MTAGDQHLLHGGTHHEVAWAQEFRQKMVGSVEWCSESQEVLGDECP